MRPVYLLLIPVVLMGCRSKTSKNNNKQATVFTPKFDASGLPTIVYKTKADYNNLVPVILSDDKGTIVSYPHPSDVITGDTYKVPTQLKGGYLLDNRGIGKNVAFINMTYEAYAKQKTAPSMAELYQLIIDKDPLLEMCNCGNRSALTDPVGQLNTLIDSSRLRTSCLPIK